MRFQDTVSRVITQTFTGAQDNTVYKVVTNYERINSSTYKVRSMTVSGGVFDAKYMLTIAGEGDGSVTGAPGTLDCIFVAGQSTSGSTCTEDVASSQTVTLTATPAVGSVFMRWDGCDAVQNDDSCIQTLEANDTVTAVFAVGADRDINVKRDGVSISNGGADNVGSHAADTPVTLTYEVANVGLTTLLQVEAFSISSETNVNGGAVFYPETLEVTHQESDTFTVTFTPTDDGDFSFDVTIEHNDAEGSIALYTFTVSGSTGASDAERTSSIIQNFIHRRIDQLTSNETDLTGRLDLRGEGDLADGSFALTSDGNMTRLNVSAATSLLRLMQQTRQTRQTPQSQQTQPSQSEAGQSAALPGTDYGLVGAPVTSGPEGSAVPQTPLPFTSPFGVDMPNYDVWMKTSFVRMEGDNGSGSGSNDGSLGLLYVGADYLINDHTVLGFLTQLDWMEEEDKSANYSVDGIGWMAGPYVVTRLYDEVVFDGRVAWGQSYNSIKPDGTYEDEFDTERWLVRGQLTGRLQVGEFTVSPHVRALYIEERQLAYTNNANVVIPDQTVGLGRLVFGPTVSYSHQMPSGILVEPSVTLEGLWDFDPADLVDIDSGDSYGSAEDLRARVEAGMRLSMGTGYNFNLSAFYDGIGVDKVDSYGGAVSVRIPLN